MPSHACQQKAKCIEANNTTEPESFSFDQGCKRALSSDKDFFRESKAGSIARFLDCQPVSVSVKRQKCDATELWMLSSGASSESLKAVCGSY
ncbi:hypothetical protein BCR43DRAFT_499264 [Syncephalastrum racemosum]|uniref:Uncharacterized protein n=1 Tax=Syncephalastrum racemosum TaxID=13706 RepID=A0A1X2H009_SYNRA|nr:hypothetical protein BCR43DRAFT_499264 [Syncephalastrum racemosum]